MAIRLPHAPCTKSGSVTLPALAFARCSGASVVRSDGRPTRTTISARPPSAVNAKRHDQNSADKAPMPGLRMMPSVRPDVTKAMALGATFSPRSPAIAMAMPSIPPLATPVRMRVAMPVSNVGTKEVAIDARPNTSVEGTRTTSRPYRSDTLPRIGAMSASGRL